MKKVGIMLLIVSIIVGIIIGIVIGSFVFNKTNSSTEIIKTRTDSFSLEKIEPKNSFIDISYSVDDCKSELYKRTETNLEIKDLTCNIDHTQSVIYGEYSDSIRVMAFCYCDFNLN